MNILKAMFKTKVFKRCNLNEINFIPESFNTNISHQLFGYTISFVKTQIQKVILYSKTGFKVCFKDFRYTRINPTQIWYDKFNQ